MSRATWWVFLWIITTVCLTGGCRTGLAQPAAPGPRVTQIVQHYFVPLDEVIGDYKGQTVDLNPARFYNHLGGDCGRMGPGEKGIGWVRHAVHIANGPNPIGSWGGIWHSLKGLAREDENTLDFAAPYDFVLRQWQPRIVGIQVVARGSGPLKVELKSSKHPDEDLLWEAWPKLSDQYTTQTMPCDPEKLRKVKFLNFVAEAGSRIDIDSIGLVVEYPDSLSIEQRAFLASYAKLARCYSRENGAVRDRSNFEATAFDCTPTSGLFAAATAAAWQLGMVDRSFAEEALRAVYHTMARVPRAYGLLPHFVHRPKSPLRELRERQNLSTGEMAAHAGVTLQEWCRAEAGSAIPQAALPVLRDLGGAEDLAQQQREWATQPYRIVSGTEFSTVDSALYYHGMLVAARMLDDEETLAGLLKEIRAIEFEKLRDANGYVTMGVKDDAVAKLDASWGATGGETALVELLARMAARDDAPAKMDRGKPYQGVGFIIEIQSLFYPQFSQHTPDLLTQMDWAQAREDMLTAQMSYFPKDTPASRIGLYGLSATEGFRGLGYFANGLEVPQPKTIRLPNGMELPQPDLIAPHYLMMSAALRTDREAFRASLAQMEQRGILTPWGCVENVTPGLDEYCPMAGSLNASFEAIGAAHALAVATGAKDAIYEAGLRCTPMAQAMGLFYPPGR